VAKIRAFLSGRWGFTLLTFFVCLLAYGLLIPRLGFYWDDWPLAWFYRWLGPGGFIGIWAKDRPAIGPLFMATSALLGDVPWHWHLFGLLTRWLSVLTLWKALQALWPDRVRLVRWTALLFAVYPGFASQSIPYVYSHYFLVQAILFASWRWMIMALRQPERRKLHWALALIGSLVSTFTLEFFLGLELLRVFLIYFTIGGDASLSRTEKTKTTVRKWAPFGAIFGVFLVWRIFVVQFKAYQPVLLDQLATAPFVGLSSLVETMVGDWVQSVVLAWAQIFNLPVPSQFGMLSTLFFWLVAALASMVIGLFLWAGRDAARSEDGSSGATWRRQALVLSAASLVMGGWPFWVTGLALELYFPLDRFTLGYMFAASLLLVLGIETIGRKLWAKSVVLSLIMALAIGGHFQIANQYRRAWEEQARVLWQLSWRVPDLEPGTVILTNEMPLDYMTDNSLTGALNWMYAPRSGGETMPYMVFEVKKRLGLGLTGLSPGLEIEQRYRTLTFYGNTSQALVMIYNPTGCLRVLDPFLDDSSPSIPVMVKRALPLSRLDLIITEPDEPTLPPAPLQPLEPEHGWCYYFQSADLARQQRDWARVVELGEIAFGLDQQPDHAEERIPFIEGYAHMGYWDRAVELTRQSLQHNPAVSRTLCHAWNRIRSSMEGTAFNQEAISNMLAELNCQD
jgi:hypothetical protein